MCKCPQFSVILCANAPQFSHAYINRPVARHFCGGGQIGQILGPFMITRGLSCDRVEFGHFGGGQMTPLTPPPATGLIKFQTMHHLIIMLFIFSGPFDNNIY